jgi:hypothetical protein
MRNAHAVLVSHVFLCSVGRYIKECVGGVNGCCVRHSSAASLFFCGSQKPVVRKTFYAALSAAHNTCALSNLAPNLLANDKIIKFARARQLKRRNTQARRDGHQRLGATKEWKWRATNRLRSFSRSTRKGGRKKKKRYAWEMNPPQRACALLSPSCECKKKKRNVYFLGGNISLTSA